MSPEQAEGRLDLLAPASDIYSLGATLYAEALATDPKLAGERHAQRRYGAACSAVLAAATRTTPTLYFPIEGEEKTNVHSVRGAVHAHASPRPL